MSEKMKESKRELILETVNEKVERGRPVLNDNMAIVPLLAKEVTAPGYVLIQEALKEGQVEIKEGGEVSGLILVNKGDRPVLLIQGQELVSKSQHRQVNTSILAPKGELTIPVACIEARRALTKGLDFSTGRMATPNVRALTLRSVNENLRRGISFRADQAGVWGEIESVLDQHEAPSPTRAHSSIWEKLEKDKQFKKFREKFKHGDDQCGVVILIDGELVDMELFDSPDTYHEMHDSIVDAYAAQAFKSRQKRELSEEEVDQKLTDFGMKLNEMEAETYKGVGLGENTRMKAEGYAGEALTHQDKVIHLMIVKLQEGVGPRGSDWEARGILRPPEGALRSGTAPEGTDVL